MRIFWKFWTEAKTDEKAERVFARVIKDMGITHESLSIMPYEKTGGYVISFFSTPSADPWNEAIIETIALGQKVARQWLISGCILSDPSGWSNEPRVTGVTAASWDVDRQIG